MAKKALAILCTIILVGCNFSKLTTIEYHNQVGDAMNTASDLFEQTIEEYDSSVPDLVTEESEIDTAAMEATFNQTKSSLSRVEATLSLESKDEDQQTEAQEELGNYLNLGEEYLDIYETMIEYYSSGTYLEDLTLVSEYDTQIYDTYNEFIESNNELADILGKYI